MKYSEEVYGAFFTLINDKDGRVMTRFMADVFLDAAMERVPMLAASLFGLSRGAIEISERMAVWPGVSAPKKKRWWEWFK